MTKGPDFDLLVVGAGPAGIAAAMRARWVKRYSVVPCHVAIIDPATPGGLTQMGTCIMTSPSWIYTDETIRPLLVDDVEHFGVPHIRARVTEVSREGELFVVSCSDGSRLTSYCVVICAGMKMLTREPELWNQGVTATSMGIEWVVGKIRHWVTDPKHRRIVFAGSDKLVNLMPLARQYRAAHVDLRFVLEPIAGQAAPADVVASDDVTLGTVIDMRGTPLRAITVQHPTTGALHEIDDIDLFVVDFLSYEVRPARNFACLGVALDGNGFIDVDRRQHTNVPGLFAAGDVTGTPACVGTAMGEGIVAGFEAYRYVYGKKFNAEPPLFAYYGHDAPLQEGFEELPRVPESLGPRLLGSSEDVLRRATERSSEDERERITRTITAVAQRGGAGLNIPQIAGAAELSPSDVAFAVRRLLEMKLITLSEVAS